jgi:hypothetical protein
VKEAAEKRQQCTVCGQEKRTIRRIWVKGEEAPRGLACSLWCSLKLLKPRGEE